MGLAGTRFNAILVTYDSEAFGLLQVRGIFYSVHSRSISDDICDSLDNTCKLAAFQRRFLAMQFALCRRMIKIVRGLHVPALR